MKSDLYYIYVLLSLKDNNLYIGCTSNLDKRLKYHNQGRVKSTQNRRPFKLVYFEEYTDKYLAFKTERSYKTAKGKRILKSKIKNNTYSGVV
ncbi:MAG TPA: GIY-YIG nuclease family protein [Patescibacteria group bacterium]|nr:GIY-YIG nuclease family protein [Patescibacteria group bacterium]